MAKKLKPEQYWQWSCLIGDLWLKKSKLIEKELKLRLMEKDMEISRLRHGMAKHSMNSDHANVEKAKNDYNEFKQVLEKDLKMSLDDCVIDDITFEVKKIED